jgi:hypothetical protein
MLHCRVKLQACETTYMKSNTKLVLPQGVQCGTLTIYQIVSVPIGKAQVDRFIDIGQFDIIIY